MNILNNLLRLAAVLAAAEIVVRGVTGEIKYRREFKQYREQLVLRALNHPATEELEIIPMVRCTEKAPFIQRWFGKSFVTEWEVDWDLFTWNITCLHTYLRTKTQREEKK